MLAMLSDNMISKMEEEKPKIVLFITDNSLPDLQCIYSKIADYISKKYYLAKVFGLANIFEYAGKLWWVKLYKYKGERI